MRIRRREGSTGRDAVDGVDQRTDLVSVWGRCPITGLIGTGAPETGIFSPVIGSLSANTTRRLPLFSRSSGLGEIREQESRQRLDAAACDTTDQNHRRRPHMAGGQQSAEVCIGADQDPILRAGGLQHGAVLGIAKADRADVRDVPAGSGQDRDQAGGQVVVEQNPHAEGRSGT